MKAQSHEALQQNCKGSCTGLHCSLVVARVSILARFSGSTLCTSGAGTGAASRLADCVPLPEAEAEVEAGVDADPFAVAPLDEAAWPAAWSPVAWRVLVLGSCAWYSGPTRIRGCPRIAIQGNGRELLTSSSSESESTIAGSGGSHEEANEWD